MKAMTRATERAARSKDKTISRMPCDLVTRRSGRATRSSPKAKAACS